VQVFLEIEKLTRRVLPLVSLFEAPTIAQLAVILRQEGWKEPWDCLVPLRPVGSRLPFYCVHGKDGNVLEFSSLTRYCDSDQPFYGIQALGLNGKEPRPSSVEEMAVRYLQEIRAMQPQGPYCLGGSSFGGMVAYEIAQQLVAQGEEVGALVLFDTHAPGYPRRLEMTAFRSRLNAARYRFSLHWTNLKAIPPVERWDYIQVKTGRLLRHSLARHTQRWQLLRGRIRNLLLPRHIRKVQESGAAANRAYAPKPYPGKIILLRAAQQPPGIEPDRTNGWSELACGGIDIHDIPGHHGSIMYEPRVRVLVRVLMECLRAVQPEPCRTTVSGGDHEHQNPVTNLC
jgi:thioesterase domain-containing protein